MSDYIVDTHTLFIVDDDTDEMQITCPAQYEYTQERQRIVYTMCVEDEEIETAITVSGGAVEIKRSSGIVADLHLRAGETVADKYIADFGTMDIEYTAEKIENSLGECGGTLRMLYSMSIGGATTRNAVTVTVRRKD